MQDPNTPKDARIADALVEIGPSVMLGATTTFLGVMPLAFANNVVFRVFFKMFIVIISFGVSTDVSRAAILSLYEVCFSCRERQAQCKHSA